MGDPKKARKKYATPGRPWEGTRIDSENKVIKEYGLKNKREIWSAESKLRKFRAQARSLIGMKDLEADKRKQNLLSKLIKFGILEKNATLDDVLALELRDLLDRRVQSLVFKKGVANTPKNARQLILHGHITIKGNKHTAPSAFVLKEDEDKITYIGPKRVPPKKGKKTKEPDDGIKVDEIGKKPEAEPEPEKKAEAQEPAKEAPSPETPKPGGEVK